MNPLTVEIFVLILGVRNNHLVTSTLVAVIIGNVEMGLGFRFLRKGVVLGFVRHRRPDTFRGPYL